MVHHPILALFLLIVDSTLIVWLWQTVFPSWDDFFHAVGYWLKPDWLSMIQGDYAQDSWETLKLFFTVAVTAALVYAPIHAAFN